MGTLKEESTDTIKEEISRQVSRKDARILEKKQRTQSKYLNGPAIRNELIPFMNQVKRQQERIKTLNDRITLHDITIHTLRTILIEHKIISEEQMMIIAEKELNKFNALQEIQKGQGDYEKRIEICKQHDIPIEQTVIPHQLREDTELLEKEKKELLERHDISEEVVWPPEVQEEKT